MKDDTTRPTSTHLGSVAEQIDGICDDFECRWRNGESPMIEWYLGRIDPSHQSRLLAELIGIEIYWRRLRDEEPAIDDYRERFAEHEDVLQREFSPSGRRSSDVVLADASQSQLGDTSAVQGTVPRVRSAQSAPFARRPAMEFPCRFGEYELLEEIGHGGMGVVYRAEQRAANRIVALKVISQDKLGQLPEHSQANALNRFRDEARAAARLQHENLVTVYDVGEIDGQPFFSMQLIEGSNVAQLVREAPLAPQVAARYLQEVACAVAEAHAHKILHRDLKPHNILICAKTDGPKVADFGLAKFQTRQDAATSAGQIMGTAQYMAPEQALDSSRAVPTSDIYSLGATLYQMLTGRPPFQAATGVETLRQVLDDHPAAPRELNPAIPRDLETICLKCMEKEPSRRYQSAQMLADDLSRFLAGQTIFARPVGPVSRFTRWCRRNPAIAALSAAVIASMLIVSGLLLESNRRDRAALTQVVLAKQESDDSFRQARAAVDHLLTNVSENTLLNQPGLEPLRKQLLEEALVYYRQFVEKPNAPLAQDELAQLHFRIGRITADVDSPAESLAWYERALNLQRALVAKSADNTARRVALGDTLNFYGQALAKTGRLGEAETALAESLAIRGQLADNRGNDIEIRRKLANIHMNLGQIFKEQGKLAAAETEFRTAQRIRIDALGEAPENLALKTDRAMGHFNSANLAIAKGQDVAAREELDKAIALFDKLVEVQPELLENRYRLAMCLRVSADLEALKDDTQEAAVLYAQSFDMLKVVTQLNPHVDIYQSALAGVHLSQASMLQSAGEHAEASRHLREAIAVYQILSRDNPEHPHFERDLAAAYFALGVCLAAMDAVQTARESLIDAKITVESLTAQFPANARYRQLLNQIDGELAAFEDLSLPREPRDESVIPGPPEP